MRVIELEGTLETPTLNAEFGETPSLMRTLDSELRPMPEISIGTVESGEEAAATMSGTYSHPVLNLVLPKGDKGDDYVLTEEDKEEIAGLVDAPVTSVNGRTGDVTGLQDSFVIHATEDPNNLGHYIFDKTWVEISQAIIRNKSVFVQTVDATHPYTTSVRIGVLSYLVFGGGFLADSTYFELCMVATDVNGTVIGMIVNGSQGLVTSVNGQVGDVTVTIPDQSTVVIDVGIYNELTSGSATLIYLSPSKYTQIKDAVNAGRDVVLRGSVRAYYTFFGSTTQTLTAEFSASLVSFGSGKYFFGGITTDGNHEIAVGFNIGEEEAYAFAIVQSSIADAEAVRNAIPTKTSDILNDSGFVNSAQAASAAPVQSVNGQTGAVTLTETDPVFSASAASGITASDITAWNGKQDALTFDDAPTDNSDNPVKSNGIYDALSGKQDAGNYAASAANDTTHSAVRSVGIPMGEVDSTSTNTAFTATVPGITSYFHGMTVLLRNGVVTSTTNFTININGLGAKPVYSNMATGNPITPTNPTRESSIFNINYTMLFYYSETLVDGGAFICYRGYNSDTNTIGYQLRTHSYSRNTVSRTRYYRLLFSSADDTKWVPANTTYDNSATSVKPVNTVPINPFGEIGYLSNTTSYTAGAAVSSTAVWQQYAFALGYSFNNTGAALTLTAKKPVYVKCTPQADCSAIIDSTTPIVQDLPSTADGKIYIFLGMAYSATNVEMTMKHPVYHYYNGAIRLWTGPI